ncbi:hypothetical protein [Acetobacteroides hydrogenigenes]|uniref:Uncharacterized protein n=1 Tax=Acetobacteroides hydrogenigenes TaxID=979970 RepID=A0A4R2EHS8_9BACT|nr:hypothetical protein [Acetobacteroides hydrogenigenes]TCN67627.1 hypothetical protein CLV25_10786 [Acetobacteroides hydrogenigenes]
MGFLDSIFSSGASNIVSAVGGVVDNIVTTKEEKMQLENEIKKAEMQYQIEMRKLNLEETGQVFADVKDARAMASTVQTSANSTKLSKNVGPYLALGTTLLTFALFFALIFGFCEKGNTKEIVLYILGVLSAIVTQIFSFYFGSSQSSKDKNQTIQNLTEVK